jgi:mitochondrial chaperone BCS1
MTKHLDRVSDSTMQFHGGVKKIAEPVLAVTSIVATGKRLYEWGRSKVSYTIAINRSDYIYGDVHVWLLGQIGQKTVRSITAASVYVPHGDDDYEHRVMQYYSDDQKSHTLMMDGRRIGVALEIPDLTNYSELGKPADRRQERIIFTAYSSEARQSVERLLERILAERIGCSSLPELHLMNKWGSWSRRNDIPLRTMDSVVLPVGQAEGILADLRQFLDSESEYVRRSLPYHRGYLLEGSPGSGKSSLVQALATECNLNLWYLPLKDVDRDANLIQLVQEVPAKSILLLEDIDGFAGAHDRAEGDESDRGASLMGLLNTLDGVATPFGLVCFMTSNHPELLDPALIRPGRVDRREHIGHVTQDQADRLFEMFYQRPARANVRITPTTSAADILGVCKRHLYSAEDAEEELCPRKSLSLVS